MVGIAQFILDHFRNTIDRNQLQGFLKNVTGELPARSAVQAISQSNQLMQPQ
jgi:hypothetical protein